jgi:hypothetical protein
VSAMTALVLRAETRTEATDDAPNNALGRSAEAYEDGL